MKRRAHEHASLQGVRDLFESTLIQQVPGVVVNGDTLHRLPNTSHLSFDGCESIELIELLDAAGIECSAGSACMAGKIRPSHVQLAMGLDGSRGRSSLRFSFSLMNTHDEARAAAALVKREVERLRNGGALMDSVRACGLTSS
jgi:cysteine desulfurase